MSRHPVRLATPVEVEHLHVVAPAIEEYVQITAGRLVAQCPLRQRARAGEALVAICGARAVGLGFLGQAPPQVPSGAASSTASNLSRAPAFGLIGALRQKPARLTSITAPVVQRRRRYAFFCRQLAPKRLCSSIILARTASLCSCLFLHARAQCGRISRTGEAVPIRLGVTSAVAPASISGGQEPAPMSAR